MSTADAPDRGYRDPTYRERCALCDELAARRCPQCARPLCSRHAPAPYGQMCPDCELELSGKQGEVRSIKNGVSWMFALGGAAGLLIAGPLAAVAAGAAVAVAQGVGAGVEAVSRRLFRRRGHRAEAQEILEGQEPRIAAQQPDPEGRRRLGVQGPQRAKKPMDYRQYRRYH